MKLHLPKLLLTAVLAVCSVADAAVTTAQSISVGGTTYTGNVSIMGGTGDLSANNLKGVDYSAPKSEISRMRATEILNMLPDDGEHVPVLRMDLKILQHSGHSFHRF